MLKISTAGANSLRIRVRRLAAALRTVLFTTSIIVRNNKGGIIQSTIGEATNLGASTAVRHAVARIVASFAHSSQVVHVGLVTPSEVRPASNVGKDGSTAFNMRWNMRNAL